MRIENIFVQDTSNMNKKTKTNNSLIMECITVQQHDDSLPSHPV